VGTNVWKSESVSPCDAYRLLAALLVMRSPEYKHAGCAASDSAALQQASLAGGSAGLVHTARSVSDAIVAFLPPQKASFTHGI